MSAFKTSKPATTTTSQDTLKSALSKHLYCGTGPLEARESSRFFVDGKDGRSVMLRGVNLSGSVKMPFSPLLPTHESRDFFKATHVSFVGRPFPLSEADEHFARLSSWGFNFLRFNVTWEAIEHEAPGAYDDEYIAYVVQVLLKAKEYGFRAFMDPHQDVWSRFTGGSGAPLWTLETVGLVAENFGDTFSALVQNTYPDPSHFPKMIWPTNYWKLATSTMFTLFFGGRVFAPKCMVNGVNIQDYLQEHYCMAVARLARAIKGAGLCDSVVLGYDTLNEPSMGFIGVEDVRCIAKEQELRKGLTPSPLQAMLLGMGNRVERVEEWDMTAIGPQKLADRILDPKGVKAWKGNCVWAEHGVWDPITQQCLSPHYFANNPQTGARVNPLVDFWKPFVNRYAAAVRDVHPNAMIFIEPPVNAFPPVWNPRDGDCGGPLVYAPHWYDGLTLVNKHWNSWLNVDYIGFLRGMYSSIAFAVKFGESAIKKAFQSQLRMLRLEGQEALGGYPTVFGEIGIPFDLDGKAAYTTGDYSAQISALDANMCALERDLLSFTLWNYTSDNSHEWGDQWNGEDLSLYSPLPNPTSSPEENAPLLAESAEDEQGEKVDLNRGGRACSAFVRPFPIATPGTPKQMSFDVKEGVFTYAFTHALTSNGKWDISSHGLSSTACEIYLPQIQYGSRAEDVTVWVSGGEAAVLPDHQRVVWHCGCVVSESASGSVSPASDEEEEGDEASQTSDVPLTGTTPGRRRKVGDSVIAHKIVVQRRRRVDEGMSTTDGRGKDGAVIALEMDRDDEGGICPSACCIS